MQFVGKKNARENHPCYSSVFISVLHTVSHHCLLCI